MEDFSKTQSTSGSRVRFSSAKTPTLTRKSFYTTNPQPQLHQQNQPSPSPPACNPQKLSTLTSTLQLELSRIHTLNKLLSENTSAQECQCENFESYGLLAVGLRDGERLAKGRIAQAAARVEQDTMEMGRNRDFGIKIGEKGVRDQVEELGMAKGKIFGQFNKEKGEKYGEMRNQVAILRKQVASFKKQSSNFRGDIFGILNSIRAQLNNEVSQQEQKRKSYDEIIQNLLQKSCEKAQQMLRRKL